MPTAPQLHTGWLSKEGHLVRSWKRRYFVLEDGVLTYSATPEDSTPLGRIPLGTATVKRKELPLGKWMRKMPS